VRHYDHYAGIYFGVLDMRICLHSIRNVKRISVDEPISMIWTDDRTYAKYLTPTFELLWPHQSLQQSEYKSCLSKVPHRLTTSRIAAQRCRITSLFLTTPK
jgi:hypothetical protein